MIDPLRPPLLTADLPGVGGAIKRQPEDFVVEEIPAYAPCGAGDHLYLWIEKRGLGAEYLVRQIARRLEVPTDDIGTAGNKDRHAVTRQMVSVPARAEAHLGNLDGDGLRILNVSRHTNKLRLGHLHGNRFRVLVRDAVALPDVVDEIARRIRTLGLPNFYGTQRFGVRGGTLETGWQLLRGADMSRRPSFFLRKLALSAVQSGLFNCYLAARLADGLHRTVLPGDVLAKYPAGGMFCSTNPAVDQPRLEQREVVPAGPMFGHKTFPAQGVAADREAQLLQAYGLSPTSFIGFGKLLQGTRRHNLVYVDELKAEWEETGLRLSFTLPAGTYATILLRELMKADTPESDTANEVEG